MPRKPRNYIVTSFVHVMIQGINKSYIFNEEQDIKYYIKAMYDCKSKYDINIVAYCIMNNHAHILLEVNKIEYLSKYMQSLNTKYAGYYNKKHNRVGYVFRDRYKSEGIYSEKQLNRCIQYIYNNPVKAKICEKAEEYPYSNLRFSKIKIQEDEVIYSFIDIEEKDNRQIVMSYVNKNNLKFGNLLKNKQKLKEMVMYLRNEEKMSYRDMEKELEISRETLRKLIK